MITLLMSPGAGVRSALSEHHPTHSLIVPGAILFSAALLLTGLSLPLLHARQMFWNSRYSVWDGVVALWHQQEHGLAIVLFVFSIVFPVIKLAGLWVLWFWRLREPDRARLLRWLGGLGKWSMLDVFIVAIMIVLVKLGPLAKVEPRVGVYVFAAAIMCSMFTTMYVERLARSCLQTKTASRG